MNDTASLFRPLNVGPVTLRNRIVMSPMTRCFSFGGVPTADVAAYYQRRAQGGTGLIVTEGVGIPHPSAVDDPNIPVMHGEQALAGWKAVVDGVHASGGVIFPQLWHMGPMRKAGIGAFPDARPMRPSGIWGPDGGHPVWGLDTAQLAMATAPVPEMSLHEIDTILQAYHDAARSALVAGFDGIAIHAAHGYLPDAFLWSGTNLRRDHFGGDAAGRTRFVVEMVKAVRSAIGPDVPIMLRFSQWKQQDYKARLAETPAELERILLPITDAGVDIFDASTRRYWEAEFAGSDLNLAGWAQRLTGKPAMTVGSVGLDQELFDGMQNGKPSTPQSLDDLLQRLERDDFALVGIGRLHLSNPDLAEKLRSGSPLKAYESSHVAELH